MNGTFKISGGRPLVGEVKPILNKNSLLGALPLAVMQCGGIAYKNLPQTTDVEALLEIYKKWGATIETVGTNFTQIDSTGVKSWAVDTEIGRKLRGAFSFVGPLLSRFGQAEVPIPGGCKLGSRSVSVHVNAFKSLGVNVEEKQGSLRFSVPKKTPKTSTVWLLEASVTATLNIAMYAAGIESEVEIIDAASEPHVTDVLKTLVRMGAKVKGIGTNRIVVKGTKDLKPTEFVASPDFVDVAGFCVASAITDGNITIKDANQPDIMDGILKWMELFGVHILRKGKDLVVSGSSLELQLDQFPLYGKDLPKFVVRPWPGFPVDILPVMVTLATKTRGTMLFQNWMYESGFDFVRELNYLGAEIFISDPQKIIVMEPKVEYHGGEVAAPGIIQGTKAIFLAALADPVETIVHGTDILRRRYPNILETYLNLGADIERY